MAIGEVLIGQTKGFGKSVRNLFDNSHLEYGHLKGRIFGFAFVSEPGKIRVGFCRICRSISNDNLENGKAQKLRK